jgi:hypothetical protein
VVKVPVVKVSGAEDVTEAVSVRDGRGAGVFEAPPQAPASRAGTARTTAILVRVSRAIIFAPASGILWFEHAPRRAVPPMGACLGQSAVTGNEGPLPPGREAPGSAAPPWYRPEWAGGPTLRGAAAIGLVGPLLPPPG